MSFLMLFGVFATLASRELYLLFRDGFLLGSHISRDRLPRLPRLRLRRLFPLDW